MFMMTTPVKTAIGLRFIGPLHLECFCLTPFINAKISDPCRYWRFDCCICASPTYPLDCHSLTVNLTDPVFRGRYHGREKHHGQLAQSCDQTISTFAHMLVRSKRAGVVSMIITGGSLRESKQALNLAKEHSTCWDSHPCPRGIC
jgi:hypothetical protein